MLIFTLANERQRRQIHHTSGPLEFGRGPERDLPRVVVEDRYTSRDQLRVEELPSGDIVVQNLGAPVKLATGQSLPTGERCTLRAPTRLSFGFTTLEIGVIPDGDEFASSLQTIMRPLRSQDAGTQTQFKGLGESPSPETLAAWFETLLTVQKSAAGSGEFYKETAKAIVELVGLDRGVVLLRQGDAWEVVASHSSDGRRAAHYSRRVVEQAVSLRRTYYQNFPDGGSGASLALVDAVVASPVFGPCEEVVGAVYGSRDMRTASQRGGIQPLEAQLVQVLAGAVSAGLARQQQEAEAARARVQFEQFFSPELAQALAKDPQILAAQERELTLVFADLRGFSRIAEQFSAREVYDLLSDILDRLTNQVMDHGGVVIDYYGDGLAAMWNAPFDQPAHAEIAVRAAQAMQREMAELNVHWAERLGGLVRLGIGINSGKSQVGNSGSKRRIKYGPRGHAVNLASRVESATKVLGVPCLLTESTRERLPPDVPVRRICAARLTGMVTPTKLYELAPERPPATWGEMRDLYERALALYEEDQAAACLDVLERLIGKFGSQDVPTIRLQLRAQARLAQPSAEFDSVVSVDTK